MRPDVIPPGATPGMLSQVISHVAELDGHLRAQMEGLPPGLGELGRFAGLFTEDSGKLRSMQGRLWESISMLEPLLRRAGDFLSGADKDNARPCVHQALDIVSDQSRMVTEVRDAINVSQEDFLPIFAALHGWIDNYNREMAELENSASEAQRMRKKYNDEKYYFLALGVLGLPGLATAIGLLVTWEEKAKKYEARLNESRHILFAVEQCKNTLTAMQGECANILNQVSEICNAQNLLLGDIQRIREDIDHVDSSILSLYLRAALGMLDALKMDAS